MFAQSRCGPFCEPYLAALAALGGLEDPPAFGLGERAANLESPRSSAEVQVFPLETLELATPQPGSDRQDVEGFESVFTCHLEENAYLLAVERPYLLFAGPRGLYRAGGVAGYE